MKYAILFLISAVMLYGMQWCDETTPLLYKEKKKEPPIPMFPTHLYQDCKKMYLEINPKADLNELRSYWQLTGSAHDFNTIFTLLLKAHCIKYQSGTTSRIVTLPISIFAANGRP